VAAPPDPKAGRSTSKGLADLLGPRLPPRDPPLQAPKAAPPPARRRTPSLEEISSSLLLPDDETSSSGILPGLEELSGSLLLEDPTVVREDLIGVPFAAHHLEAAPPPAPSASQLEKTVELTAASADRTEQEMPAMPPATPGPTFDTLPTVAMPAIARPDGAAPLTKTERSAPRASAPPAHAPQASADALPTVALPAVALPPLALPSTTPTKRPPAPLDTDLQPVPASPPSVDAAPGPDGVPPPPQHMYDALHGYETSQPPLAQAASQAPGGAPAPGAGEARVSPPPSDPVPDDIELNALPRSPIDVAKAAARSAIAALTSTFDEGSAGDARKRWFLPAIAVAGLVVGVGLVAIVVSVARKGGDDTDAHTTASAPTAPASAGPSALSPAPAAERIATTPTTPTTQPVAAAEAVPAAPAVSAPPAEAVASTTPCKVTGKTRVLAPSAIVQAGVEVRSIGGDVAVGFAPSEHQATALRIDAASLSTSSTVDAQSSESIRRVVPLGSADGALSVAADTDRDGDVLRGRRTVALDPPVEIGGSAGGLVWAHPGGAAAGRIWPLGDGTVEALRGTADAVAPSAGALAMRLGGDIWMGAVTARDGLAPNGALSKAIGSGASVGSPAIAMNDGVVLVAWADRVSAQDPWRMRWVRFKAGEAPGEPGTFTPPAGGKGEQAMSPGIAAIPGGRFLLVWTEGPATRHDVRAITLSREGQPIGKPLDISGKSVNAGQGQAAVNAARQGLVAYLESTPENGFRVVSTAITCGP
jgi:hypothetical protein